MDIDTTIFKICPFLLIKNDDDDKCNKYTRDDARISIIQEV